MKLVHFTKDPLTEILPTGPNEKIGAYKTPGFWVSDEDEYGWKAWCEAEGFHLDGLKLAYEIQLVEKHNCLILTTVDEIIGFSNGFKGGLEGYQLDWDRIRSRWNGLIITPYQWDLRLELDHLWYYGWDCASGCIWNIKAIESFKLITFDTCQNEG